MANSFIPYVPPQPTTAAKRFPRTHPGNLTFLIIARKLSEVLRLLRYPLERQPYAKVNGDDMIMPNINGK
jgi:hypothetical protein